MHDTSFQKMQGTGQNTEGEDDLVLVERPWIVAPQPLLPAKEEDTLDPPVLPMEEDDVHFHLEDEEDEDEYVLDDDNIKEVLFVQREQQQRPSWWPRGFALGGFILAMAIYALGYALCFYSSSPAPIYNDTILQNRVSALEAEVRALHSRYVEALQGKHACERSAHPFVPLEPTSWTKEWIPTWWNTVKLSPSFAWPELSVPEFFVGFSMPLWMKHQPTMPKLPSFPLWMELPSMSLRTKLPSMPQWLKHFSIPNPPSTPLWIKEFGVPLWMKQTPDFPTWIKQNSGSFVNRMKNTTEWMWPSDTQVKEWKRWWLETPQPIKQLYSLPTWLADWVSSWH